MKFEISDGIDGHVPATGELWLIPKDIILEPGERLGDWLRRQLREKRAAVITNVDLSGADAVHPARALTSSDETKERPE